MLTWDENMRCDAMRRRGPLRRKQLTHHIKYKRRSIHTHTCRLSVALQLCILKAFDIRFLLLKRLSLVVYFYSPPATTSTLSLALTPLATIWRQCCNALHLDCIDSDEMLYAIRWWKQSRSCENERKLIEWYKIEFDFVSANENLARAFVLDWELREKRRRANNGMRIATLSTTLDESSSSGWRQKV